MPRISKTRPSKKAPTLKLRRRFNRKVALKSLRRRHSRMDRQAKVIRENKHVSHAILSSVISI